MGVNLRLGRGLKSSGGFAQQKNHQFAGQLGGKLDFFGCFFGQLKVKVDYITKND